MKQQPLDLSGVFRLKFRDADVFEGESPAYAWGSAYGGLLVGQALWAATQTVAEDFWPHSLHAYFLRGGAPREPIRYAVDRTRDGGSFATRRVSATQSPGEVFCLIASFHSGEAGPERQSEPFPADTTPPEDLTGRWDAGIERRDAIFSSEPPRVATWLRYPELTDPDPRIHACAAAYLSDLNPIDALVAGHANPPPDGQWDEGHICLSLDHAMWFHRRFSTDADWLLMDASGLSFSDNRGFARAGLFSRDGQLLASVMQEGLFRPRR